MFHFFYQSLESIINQLDPAKESHLSLALWESTDGEMEGESDLLDRIIIETFVEKNPRGYLFFNEKRFVQSRLIAVDLTRFMGNDSFYTSMASGVRSVEDLMKIGEETTMDVRAPTIEMVKQPILSYLDHWEQSVEQSLIGCRDHPPNKAITPSTMVIYGKACPTNANLTAMECLLLKVFYVAPKAADAHTSDWYREEKLLDKIPHIDSLHGFPHVLYGWFFNSTNHLRRCLLDALRRSRQWFISNDPDLASQLPRGNGIGEVHLEYMALDLEPSTEKTTGINADRMRGNGRGAACFGITAEISKDFTLKRLIYIHCASIARKYQEDTKLLEGTRYPIIFAFTEAKKYKEGTEIGHFQTFMATHVSSQTETRIGTPSKKRRAIRSRENPAQVQYVPDDPRAASVLRQPIPQGVREVNTSSEVFVEYKRQTSIRVSLSKGVRFSAKETDAVIAGYRKHHSRTFIWASILKDIQFGEILKRRSAMQITDKYKDLMKQKAKKHGR